MLVVDQRKAWEKDAQTKKGDFIKKQSKISYSAEASESDSGAYSHRRKYKQLLKQPDVNGLERMNRHLKLIRLL